MLFLLEDFDLRTLFFEPYDDISYIVFLPTMAATAWYHNRLAKKPEDFETFIDEVRVFTEMEYTPALFKGNRMSDDEKAQLAQNLENYTGVSADTWLRGDLKIKADEFFQELLRELLF